MQQVEIEPPAKRYQNVALGGEWGCGGHLFNTIYLLFLGVYISPCCFRTDTRARGGGL